MSGLRERQKEIRREAIRSAAISLFEKQGYQDTTVEQIARHAGVTPPTIFKYFGSKQAILMDIFKDIDKRAIEEACRSIDDYDDPLDALCALEQSIVDLTLASFPASFWRELLPMMISETGDGLLENYRKNNDLLKKAIASVLDGMKQKGVLRDDLDVNVAARLLNEYSHLQMMRLTSRDNYDMAAHRKDVRETTALVLYGMLKH